MMLLQSRFLLMTSELPLGELSLDWDRVSPCRCNRTAFNVEAGRFGSTDRVAGVASSRRVQSRSVQHLPFETSSAAYMLCSMLLYAPSLPALLLDISVEKLASRSLLPEYEKMMNKKKALDGGSTRAREEEHVTVFTLSVVHLKAWKIRGVAQGLNYESAGSIVPLIGFKPC